MSGWRVMLDEMLAAGAPMALPTREYEWDVRVARDLGLIEKVGLAKRPPRGGNAPILWALTRVGREVAANRAAVVPSSATSKRGRPRNVVAATWLASLPQGVRIAPRRCEFCARPGRAANDDGGEGEPRDSAA